MNEHINEISLENLRRTPSLEGSDFFNAYHKLAVDDDVSTAELSLLLRAAIVFLRNNDAKLNQLGYRILISYAKASGDHAPLAHVAFIKELTPLYMGLQNWREDANLSSLAETILDISANNLVHKQQNYFLTGGQARMHAAALDVTTAAFVAPTSYGKSELLVRRALEGKAQFVAIVVPTRTLIAQTRASFRGTLVDSDFRVITHNDAYVADRPTLAILTQERLARLLSDFPEAAVDHLLIDEAHNMFEADMRGTELARVVAVCRKRNPRLEVSFFSPFISNALSLNDIISPLDAQEVRVTEHIKVEDYQWSDLADGTLHVFDQFFGESFPTRVELPSDELEAIKILAGAKTLSMLVSLKWLRT